MLHSPISRTLLAMCLAGAITATLHAYDFAPAGSKVALSVEYRYKSAGTQSSEGMYDPRVWRIEQTVILTSELAAEAMQAMPSIQELDASQMAALEGMQNKAQDMSTQMAPMMASVEEIMAKCGEDEACIESAIQNMGFDMSGSPEMDKMQEARQDAAEVFKPGAPRYQAWRSTSQQGNYRIDETLHVRVTDPICMEIPGGVCTRDEVRKGEGAVPLPPGDNAAAAAGIAAVEVDAAKGTLIIRLPVPLMPLPYTETITTDEPEGTHDTPTPKGPLSQLLNFGGTGPGNLYDLKPITVAIDGDWHQQSGEQVVEIQGGYGETAQMTIHWHFGTR